MTMSLDATVRIPEDVVFRELDGEAVLLNLESGIYFGLDPVGTRIWQLVEEHRALRRVLAALLTEFDAPPADLEADLVRFVDQLRGKGLLTVV
ncbi:MAG: PqqD family protein [Acidobacteria bacterium]|nr:PqqD family protein [Acidobacteriota bacterium]